MSITDTDCPVCACAEIISGKWTLLVIRDLAAGNRRFCELERSLRESARGRCRCGCARSRSAASSSATPIPRFRPGSSTR